VTGLLASPPGVFLGLTVVLFGGAAWLAGQALAGAWRPAREALLYSLLLGAVDRFLVFALFKGELLSVYGYMLHSAVIMAVCLLAWRFTRAGKMVSQYPWLYERSGPFGWRPRGGG